MATTTHKTTNAPRLGTFMRTLFAYLFGVIFTPITTFRKFLADRQRLSYAWSAILLISVGYALVDAALFVSGHLPDPEPFLRIPSAQYYFWLQFISLVLYVTCWILAAASMHLLSKLFHGQGSFEDTLAVVGIASAAATLATLIPDLITSALGVTGIVEQKALDQFLWGGTVYQWLYMGLYALLFVVLYPLAVRAVQKIQVWQAILVGVFGVFVYSSFLFVFNR
jgi:hypothetical protein